MNDIERAVARHYGETDLLVRILDALEAVGAQTEQLGPDDLAPVEEFHIGGRKATARAVEKMRLQPDQHVLDVGCGIGGAARYIAGATGCKVTAIDLTPEYISVARELTDLTGLSANVSFDVSNAMAMPFGEACFDAALTLHVAMNIRDRNALYREVARVLRPGAVFYLFDVMKKSDEPLTFPVPWAASGETSFLTTPDETRALLEDAGFEVTQVEDRTGFALEFFEQIGSAAGNPPSALGIHLLMGESASERLGNVVTNIRSGRIAPVEMLARRTALS
jgi:SAM-dependent methyltransferase